MLNKIFEPSRIKFDLKSTTKDGAFKELVGAIAASDSKYDGPAMLEAVTLRENKMNTIIMPGVAVPHGYCGTVRGIIGAMGFSNTGIEYDSPDRNPVHLIFLLLMDQSSREKHLRVFTRLWKLLNSRTFMELLESGSPREVYDLLSAF